METLNLNLLNNIFADFSISNEEMIHIRGGEGDPIILPTQPPIKI